MRPAVRFLAISALVLGSACSGPTAWVERAREEFSQGRFTQAFESLETAKKLDEDEREIEKLWFTYRSAALLKRGQKLCFANEDIAALGEFAKVLAVDPDNRIALAWSRKCKERLANRSAEAGRAKLSGGDLDGAYEDFQEALTYWPGHEDAQAGLDRVGDELRSNRTKAKDRYVQGVRALSEQHYKETDYHMVVALDADPTLEPAAVTKREAELRLAEIRLARAREMEEDGFYSAAMRDYLAVAEADPSIEGLDERIAAMEREVEARTIARKGELALFRGDFEEARELIDQAFEISALERPAYNDLLLMAREREAERAYLLAKDVEYQGDYETAVIRFVEIEEKMPGFEDVPARIKSLQDSLEAAEESYRAALAAIETGDTESAVQLLRDVQLYVPKYRDVSERLAELAPEEDDAEEPEAQPVTEPAPGSDDS